jgi:Domain of unknown function (DUF6250)
MEDSAEILVGDDLFRGRLIREGIGSDLSEWFQEGLGQFSMPKDNVMEVNALAGGYSAFLKKPLPADLLVQYSCRTLAPEAMGNINLISHCQPERFGNWPIVEAGRYKGYRDMPNYIVTFVSGIDEEQGIRECSGRQRLRRNPGFTLIKEKQDYPNEVERQYQIIFSVLKGRVRYYIDGQKIFDWSDPQPITGRGFFAFRTYKTREVYSDLRILELAPAGNVLPEST